MGARKEGGREEGNDGECSTYAKVATVEEVDDRVDHGVGDRKPLTDERDEHKPVERLGEDGLTRGAHPHDHIVQLDGQPTDGKGDHQQNQHSIQLWQWENY